MEPERLEFFRNLLQERLEEILGESDKTRIDMTGVTAPFPDPRTGPPWRRIGTSPSGSATGNGN